MTEIAKSKREGDRNLLNNDIISASLISARNHKSQPPVNRSFHDS